MENKHSGSDSGCVCVCLCMLCVLCVCAYVHMSAAAHLWLVLQLMVERPQVVQLLTQLHQGVMLLADVLLQHLHGQLHLLLHANLHLQLPLHVLHGWPRQIAHSHIKSHTHSHTQCRETTHNLSHCGSTMWLPEHALLGHQKVREGKNEYQSHAQSNMKFNNVPTLLKEGS